MAYRSLFLRTTASCTKTQIMKQSFNNVSFLRTKNTLKVLKTPKTEWVQGILGGLSPKKVKNNTPTPPKKHPSSILCETMTRNLQNYTKHRQLIYYWISIRFLVNRGGKDCHPHHTRTYSVLYISHLEVRELEQVHAGGGGGQPLQVWPRACDAERRIQVLSIWQNKSADKRI